MTVAMDAMAVAIHIKYALSLNRHLTFYCRDLEIRVRAHTRSLKVVPFDRLGMVS